MIPDILEVMAVFHMEAMMKMIPSFSQSKIKI
jgi:hypothetical protein